MRTVIRLVVPFLAFFVAHACAHDPIKEIHDRFEVIHPATIETSMDANHEACFMAAAEIIHLFCNFKLPKRFDAVNSSALLKNNIAQQYEYRDSTKTERSSGCMDFLKLALSNASHVVNAISTYAYLIAKSNDWPNDSLQTLEKIISYYDIDGLIKKVTEQVDTPEKYDQSLVKHLQVVLDVFHAEKFAAIGGMTLELNRVDLGLINEQDITLLCEIHARQSAVIDLSKAWSYYVDLHHLYEAFAEAPVKNTKGQQVKQVILQTKGVSDQVMLKADIARISDYYKSQNKNNAMTVKLENKINISSAINREYFCKEHPIDKFKTQPLTLEVPEEILQNNLDLSKISLPKIIALSVLKPGKNVRIKLPQQLAVLLLQFNTKYEDIILEDYVKLIENLYSINNLPPLFRLDFEFNKVDVVQKMPTIMSEFIPKQGQKMAEQWKNALGNDYLVTIVPYHMSQYPYACMYIIKTGELLSALAKCQSMPL